MQKKQKVVNKLAESHKLLTKIKLRAPLRNVFHPFIKNFFLEISYFFLKRGVLFFFFNNLDFFLRYIKHVSSFLNQLSLGASHFHQKRDKIQSVEK